MYALARRGLILFLVAPLCGVVWSQTSETPPPVHQAISPTSLQRLGDVVREYIESDYAVGGELLVLKDGQPILHEAYGESDRVDETPWKVGVICNIRSMSKPITGVAAQILIDRQQLKPDDRVATYLPGFDNPKSRDITIEQLLTHRSGLPLTILNLRIDEYPSLLEMSNAVGEGGPKFPPGSKFWYSDAGSDAVGAVVEQITGQKLNEFVAAEIFKPLKMRDSFYGIDKDDPRFKRIASLHVGSAKAWLRFWKPRHKSFYPYAWGSQTIYSTPEDYAKFLRMLAQGGQYDGQQIISADAIDRIMKPVSPMKMLGSDQLYPTGFRGLEAWYGQLMAVYRQPDDKQATPKIFGHTGSDGTGAWAFPEQNLMVMYFTQSRGGTTVVRMESEIDRWLLHGGKEPSTDNVPEEYQPYLGTYVANFANFENEEFTVLAKNGRLALDIPSQMTFELMEPDDEGKWAFIVAPEQVKVSFVREESAVVALKLHQGGKSFDVPRKGTASANNQSETRAVSPEQMQTLVGTYYDEFNQADVVVFLKDNVLNLKAPPDLQFQLKPAVEVGRWLIKQSPKMSVTFERDESGAVVSMTRHVGEQQRVMKRTE